MPLAVTRDWALGPGWDLIVQARNSSIIAQARPDESGVLIAYYTQQRQNFVRKYWRRDPHATHAAWPAGVTRSMNACACIEAVQRATLALVGAVSATSKRVLPPATNPMCQPRK